MFWDPVLDKDSCEIGLQNFETLVTVATYSYSQIVVKIGFLHAPFPLYPCRAFMRLEIRLVCFFRNVNISCESNQGHMKQTGMLVGNFEFNP